MMNSKFLAKLILNSTSRGKITYGKKLCSNVSLIIPCRSFCSHPSVEVPVPVYQKKNETLMIQYKELLNRIQNSGIDSLEDKFLTNKSNKSNVDINSEFDSLDYTTFSVQAGDGGDGEITFDQNKDTEKGEPSGGNGGSGAHVLFKTTTNRRGLNHIKKLYIGYSGENGKSKEHHGKPAPNLFIEVPLGTKVMYRDEAVASLDEETDIYLAARGGSGGKGNIFFKSSTMMTPRMAEYGGEGEEFKYALELRTIADIGLIGFPNAGKSTLLRAISREFPRVPSYPFTNLNPHIGMIHFADLHQMPVADIPGLIKGNHRNRDLSIALLRHIVRCSSLLYVLDGSEQDPLKQLEILKSELEHYKEGLSLRPQAIVLTKMDLESSQENFLKLQNSLSLPIVPISAKMGDNLVPLFALMRLLSESKNVSVEKKSD